ncbi:MAG: LCP family protein [Propionibacteriaceae bacterium]|nr:LCP family protein [Propionibacteriaceae bacterium]
MALSIGLAIVRPKRHRLGYGLMMTAAVIITAGSLFTANVFANVKHFTDGIANGIKDVTITYLIIAPLPPNMTNPDAIGQPSGQTSTPGTTTSTTTPTTKQPTTASTHPTETTSASSTTSPHEQPRTPHTSLEQLTNANIGILLSDPNYKKATKILNNLVTANVVNLNAASDVTVAMSNNTIQGACIDRSIYRLWAEYNPEFFASIEVIKTFEMKITPDPPTPDSSDPATPFVIYISGIDTMEGLDEVGRSDSNMLFAVNPTTGHIALINTPRDYYVQLHDTSGYPDKLTHSGVYGIDMSVGTIEDLYDVEIDYWIRINFASVVDIVNAVGGIDVNVALAFRCYAGAYDWDGYDFHTGLTHMDGSQALCFSRERKAFEDGDRQRGKNQQAVIEALIEKLSRPSILLNYNAVLNALAPNMQTTMPSERITSLARRQLDLGTDWSITEYSVTGSDAYRPSYSLGAREVYVMLPDWGTVSEAKKLLTDVLSGR